jgi:hypothetical protein
MHAGTYGSALHTDILKRWQNPGDITDVPRMDNGQTARFGAQSDRWLVDASYINLRTISLSYSLPASFLSKAHVSSARVYISGENVLMLSKRKGLNAAQAFTGVTSNVYSPSRVITAGLNISL